MGYPRKWLVDPDISGFYHCVSRCVRRAFLCGGDFDYRRAWIEERLTFLISIFAIESCAYAILSNHLHLILRILPELAKTWSNTEVVERWLQLYPKKLERITQGAATERDRRRLAAKYIEELADRPDIVQKWRKKLACLSWFNKLLKEPIARRANLEDDCTGHFWEGRFRSYRLLDEAAILACMVYVDLNPFRAGMATSLEQSDFTSLLQRMKVLKAGHAPPASVPSKRPRKSATARVPNLLIPIETLFQMTAEQYVSLVAWTAGVPIDERPHGTMLGALGIDSSRWQAVLARKIKLFGTAVGSVVNLVQEAARRGASRVINPINIYAT